MQVGGNAIIAPHNHKFMGIRNGIDMELWSPEENQFLPLNYSSETVVEGKKAARQVGAWATRGVRHVKSEPAVQCAGMAWLEGRGPELERDMHLTPCALPCCFSSQALRQRLNLTSWNDKFIVAVVSRLTGQKGVPLIKHAAYRCAGLGGRRRCTGAGNTPTTETAAGCSASLALLQAAFEHLRLVQKDVC